MKRLAVFFISMFAHICYAQGVITDDFSQSGGVSIDIAIPERYEVNTVELMSPLIFDVNQLLGTPLLELGKTYTFDFEFVNTLGLDLIVPYVNTECVCEEATWDKNAIVRSDGGRIRISITFTATIPGQYTSTIKLFAQNPERTKPIAVQPVQFTYKVAE